MSVQARGLLLISVVLTTPTGGSHQNVSWYIHRELPFGNMNILDAWNLGYNGSGVVVSVVNDGVEIDHPDLIHNFDPEASINACSFESGWSPHRKTPLGSTDTLGTKDAGIIAAYSENNKTACTKGVAFGAQLGGMMVVGEGCSVNDKVEATALSYKPDYIDIYVSGWGPDFDGKTVEGPGPLAREAFLEGVLEGRKGKGSIYIWPTGLGGANNDCNTDGYTSAIYTILINSVLSTGKAPFYGEKCASVLASAYTGNDKEPSGLPIATTAVNHSCTPHTGGPSSSGAIAAGIVALTLQANPNLSWIDVQEIIVRSAKSEGLVADDWVVNGAGRKVSRTFGFGLIDAGAMVTMALGWNNRILENTEVAKIGASPGSKNYASERKGAVLRVLLDFSKLTTVTRVQHVVATITLTADRRGAVRMVLKSPMGTKCTLLDYRRKDVSAAGFKEWPFVSVHFWGENPQGVWTLEVQTDTSVLSNNNVQVGNATLAVYGPGSVNTDTGMVAEMLTELAASYWARGSSKRPTAKP